jgi:thioredoxin 1
MKRCLFFHADYCGPCHLVARELIDPAEKQLGPGKIVRVNAQDEPLKAKAYGVDQLPMFVFLEDNEVAAVYRHPPDMKKLIGWFNGDCEID